MANVLETSSSLRESYGRTIAIIGGGFSGTMVAVHLLRQAKDAGLRLLLIERSPRLARGIAYSTKFSLHLLNVPAGNMSAFPDDPEHFLRWCRARDPLSDACTFIPRRLYGDYISGVLEQTAAQSPAHLETLQGEVIALETNSDGGVSLRLKDGARLNADQVVLALGNAAPSDPAAIPPVLRENGRYIPDPWVENALGAIASGDEVLILGTGLTMVDKVIELKAQGHLGKTIALSRRGLMPQRHRLEAVSVKLPEEVFQDASAESVPTVLRLFGKMRAILERIAETTPGADWRSVVDALRPHTQALWSDLSLREKRRFLRHLKSYWEVHRHRTAPEIYAMIEEMRHTGQLEVLGGRLQRIEPRDGVVDVYFRERKTLAERKITVRHIINCTGTGCDIRKGTDPLIASLLSQGLALPDALEVGLAAEPGGALLCPDGSISDRFYTIGPLLRGTLWETTAVPELRVQAETLARRVFSTTVPS